MIIKTDSAVELALYGGVPARPQHIELSISVSEWARDRILEILSTGRLSEFYHGPWARRLETSFADFHGAGQAAVAVNSGTSALHLAICAIGIGPGDEVILPAFCFVSAASAIVQNGAIPVICDVEPDHLTIDVNRVARLITRKTKAVIAVHFWGYPSNAPALRSLCDRHGLALIEDCAQSLGGEIDGRKLGTFGDFSICSFSLRKHVSSGEGGMLMCSSARQDEIRGLCNYGKGPDWEEYRSLGYSYRLAEIPAVIALDGLGRLDSEIAARQLAARHYTETLACSGLQTVPDPNWGKSTFFTCPVLLPPGAESKKRDLVAATVAENVACRSPHRPLYRIPWLQAYLRKSGRSQDDSPCPIAASIYPRLVEIETGPNLPLSEATRTVDALLKVWRYIS